jgi:hypothetical protein
MRSNRRFREYLARSAGSPGSEALDHRLSGLAESPLLTIGGALILGALHGSVADSPWKDDLVGYEAFVNHIHVEDYLEPSCVGECRVLQAIRYCEVLDARLREREVPYRIVLSRDPESDSVTVRFFLLREGAEYGDDDPESYEGEEVAYWD